jgi:hypothetical protein
MRAMELAPYVDSIHAQLDAAAEAGGEQSLEVARRLGAPLDAAIRLALLDALGAAAEEITVELAPGSVELRLRGGEPRFAVTPPPSPEPAGAIDGAEPAPETWRPPQGEEGGMSRINLRLPDQLKARVEAAADAEGLSVNAWLVRAAAARVDRGGGRPTARGFAHGAQRYEGWAR